MRINLIYFLFYWILSFRAARCFCLIKVPSRFFLFIVLHFSLFFFLIFGTFQKRHFYLDVFCPSSLMHWSAVAVGGINSGGGGCSEAVGYCACLPSTRVEPTLLFLLYIRQSYGLWYISQCIMSFTLMSPALCISMCVVSLCFASCNVCESFCLEQIGFNWLFSVLLVKMQV